MAAGTRFSAVTLPRAGGDPDLLGLWQIVPGRFEGPGVLTAPPALVVVAPAAWRFLHQVLAEARRCATHRAREMDR